MTSDITSTIRDYLFLIETKNGPQNKLNCIIELYDYLMTIPEFLIKNNTFKIKIIDKLNEFKNDSILNDKNDNRINNREFIFSKFEIYEKFLNNLNNANKIIIKI